MIADVFSRFRRSLGDVTFPVLEGHIAARACLTKLLAWFGNFPKVTELRSALSVRAAVCRHD